MLLAGRADIGFLPKPLLHQNCDIEKDFIQIPMDETDLSMHLYIHQKDAGLKSQVESLLQQYHQPHLASINNNR